MYEMLLLLPPPLRIPSLLPFLPALLSLPPQLLPVLVQARSPLPAPRSGCASDALLPLLHRLLLPAPKFAPVAVPVAETAPVEETVPVLVAVAIAIAVPVALGGAETAWDVMLTADDGPVTHKCGNTLVVATTLAGYPVEGM